MIDFIHKGKAHGSIAQRLIANDMNLNILRPYSDRDENGEWQSLVLTGNGKDATPELTENAATLRYDEWKLIDKAVVKAAQLRLGLIQSLRDNDLVYNLPNGMAHSVLQSENQTDIGDAELGMSPLKKTDSDRPEYNSVFLPLPIISKDFSIDLRQLMQSRNGNTAFDTTMVEKCGRKVAELAENLALGTYGTYAFGGGTLYGLINYPNRLTKTMTLPTTSGWTGLTLVNEVLDMRQKSVNNRFYGPWVLYVSTNWDAFLDADYSALKGDNTLRDRIEAIRNIKSVVTLDFLGGYQAILLNLTTDVMRLVQGMDITTVQWETQGGFEINFKVLAMMVPQLRTDAYGRTGIVHGVAA